MSADSVPMWRARVCPWLAFETANCAASDGFCVLCYFFIAPRRFGVAINRSGPLDAAAEFPAALLGSGAAVERRLVTSAITSAAISTPTQPSSSATE